MTLASADTHVLARISEFVDAGVPWHRALWLPSTTLALRELVEHGEQLHAKAIGVDQVKDSVDAVRRQAARDVGLGDTAYLSALTALVTNPADVAKEQTRNSLGHLAVRGNAGYFVRWGAALAGPPASRPKPERVARYLTAHLLDADVSAERIGQLVTSAEGKDAPLQVLCAEAESLLSKPAERMKVVVPVRALPPVFLEHGDPSSRQIELLRSREAIVSQYTGDLPADFNAGLVLAVKAPDPWAAVDAARELLARLQARLSVSTTAAVLSLHVCVAVVGQPYPFALAPARRMVRVPSLDRSQKTIQISGYAEAAALDDALELLASLGQATPGAALTNGWASIEGLLVNVSEKGILAAERLADVVTADWPRSELTWLANAPVDATTTDADLRAVLSSGGPGSVQTKVAALESALADGVAVGFTRPRDVAAHSRLQALVSDPTPALTRVREGVVEALRRLYVQRNLVMHAGSFRSVARKATLRTAPPVVAAGMDRLVHAAGFGTTPLMLAARARVELDLLVASGGGRPLHRLLE